ncbi:MAG: putative toxin-antitoxin system toxin component, PIN family [Candidatus Diapherotrites archaeon]|uniref:Putative toxin-antitoxin system toxin component, PIN family n=1 Tax=Candidatus Iainarchaeum sp. TaxID=3101447 RepID=A0A8T3YPH0_9ARCH|nr:putative toxin-antitoxin system toxin component, PIN family [Candidatus Diapherotrites archaeon]
MPIILVDTNVLLSGLFFRGNERRLLEQFLLGKITLVLPEHVLMEATNIIKRKSNKLGNTENATAMLSLITEKCVVVRTAEYAHNLEKAEQLIRDKKDAPILAALMSTGHDYFVSGDKDFEALNLRTHISVRKLLELIGK